MGTTNKAGLVMGVACVAWTFVMGLAGWHTHPVLLNLFWVVVAIEVAVLIWGLSQTAAANGYWRQVRAGAMMSILGGVIIFGGSMVFTTVAFPEYFAELRQAHEAMLRAAGQSEEQVRAAVEAAARSQTPLIQAAMGLVGTVATGVLASMVIAGFPRFRGTDR